MFQVCRNSEDCVYSCNLGDVSLSSLFNSKTLQSHKYPKEISFLSLHN